MELTCEQLGITKDDIAERVAAKIASSMLTEYSTEFDDETGEEVPVEKPSPFRTLVKKRVDAKITEAVDSIAEKVMSGDLEEKLESLTFPQTNSYGEPKRDPLTLREFIARRADSYLTEKVDYQGRTGYNASGQDRIRVVWMLEQFLNERIKEEMTRSLASANAQIANGIAAAVKESLADITRRIKAEVKV